MIDKKRQEEILSDLKTKSEPKVQQHITEEERQKTARETKLARTRAIFKDKFPNLVFEENLDSIERFLNKPRCTICRSFYSQSTISDVKAKLRGGEGTYAQPFKLRLYKNSAEKCEDSKGYCIVSLLNNPSSNKHTKTLIPVPDMSLCSDWVLNNVIDSYIISLREVLLEKEREANKILEKKKLDLKKKEEALKLINDIDEKYNN